ncbi:saccharopine dehydrogenase NADP-binding domain-containing protein [Gordonia jinhuaensis]|uniref:Saccharopine dehydrogenase NADP binding domain-containing protein n=1 Tax=Gordonia jinhuaensis TaxID=1517702 RepID=A0A916TIQ9_9ACTN|nr:saccharopine dehydrogenase NADP-binding domain-containing protein [Gordonia jinhuaensis]GGB47284.1 hypothetical protein GCM10011489_38120 [Gordonia jinhuaensis]
MSAREFDIVVFGATGFVGELTARYLADHAPSGVRVALAGRNRAKLEAVRGRLPASAAGWPLLIADADAPSTLDELVARTQVVCTTVGPYLRYGEPLVAAAATAGTDYVDLTGEVPFVRWSIDKFDEVAQASGARIVHSCGFDSEPSDLGVYYLYRAVTAADAGSLTDTTLVVKAMRGGLSGGTIDSMRVIADEVRDPEIRRLMVNPHSLSSGPGEVIRTERGAERSDMTLVSASRVDPSLTGTLAPFFMASHNTRIVRRTNALLDGAYGADFRYAEAMAVGKNPVLSTAAAAALSAGMGAFFGAMALPPARKILDKVLPKPGEGPDEKSRERGYFTMQIFTKTTTGRRFRAQVSATGDPGYKATAMMLGESALTLALERDKLPSRTGVLTPAAAMGDPLIERLQEAGMVFDSVEL